MISQETKTNWDALFTNKSNRQMFISWSVGELSTRQVTERLLFSPLAGEFRKLVRTRGTTEARSLARKALRYRGVNI